MCNALYEALVRREVAGRIARKEGFTAYTITRDARASGIRIAHDDVRRVVHAMYASGAMNSYERELRDMGGPVPAYFYFDSGSSAAAHCRRPSQRARTYPTSAVRTARRSRFPADGRPGLRRVDRRGTVSVPALLVRALGLAPGDRALVVAEPDAQALRITLQTQAAADLPVRSYTVDRSANLRITRAAQRQAGLTASGYLVEHTAEGILVRREPA